MREFFTFLLALAASVGMSFATGLQVVEVTSELYAGWQGNTGPFTVDALPGFQAVTLDEAKAWTGAPTSGGAYLVYGKDDVTNSVKTAYFESGNFMADVEMMPGTTLNQLYNDLTAGGHYFYTVSSGSATPVADLSKNIAIDLRDHQLGGDGSTGGSKYLIIDSENNYTYVDDEPAAYNAYFQFQNFNGTDHGYTNLLATVPVEAGNYKLTLGACGYGNGNGNVMSEASVELAAFNQKLEANTKCYHQNTAENIVVIIFNVPTAQNITIDCGNYTPYIALEKMAAVPAFTDFEINFRTDPYNVISGTLPTGSTIAGTYNDNLHGYQNVVATVPVKAGKYRLTLGACGYGNGAGSVMSETNVELASFNQKLAENSKCYHQNTTENIVSMTFTVDIDQNITIDCGQYTPYMKLKKITAYEVEFALGEAEGVAPAAVNVTIGDELTMPVNKTMYKEGYTLTGWSDGVNTYAIGADFTPASDAVLNPVFTANAIAITEATEAVTVRWYFGKSNGAPDFAWQYNSGFLIAQATVGGNPMDVRISIDATSGKFSNSGRTDKWAQVNNGTILSFPGKADAVVTVESYNNNPEHYAINAAAGTLSCNTNDYYSYLEITYPAPAVPTTFVNITPYEDPQNTGVYYSTFFDSSVKYELPAGVEAYVAAISGSELMLTKIAEEGQVIPANEAVIFKANIDNFTLNQSDAEPVSFSATNDLKGVDVATTLESLSIEANQCYVLSGKSHDETVSGVGFYLIYGNTLKAHKAYVIYNGNNAPKRMRFVFDTATGIESIQPSAVSSQKVMENGQLFIIRNGVRYNAAGQIVK